MYKIQICKILNNISRFPVKISAYISDILFVFPFIYFVFIIITYLVSCSVIILKISKTLLDFNGNSDPLVVVDNE